MSVLKGEGRVPILFGSTSIPLGTVTHLGYLARPDLTGEWPTIVVVSGEWGITSSVKDVCRRLARQGFAVVAFDPFRGKAPARATSPDAAAAAARQLPAARVAADLDALADFISNPAGFWSNAERGFGVLALGEGGRFAVPYAALHASPLGLVATTLSGPETEEAPDVASTPLRYPLGAIASVVAPVVGLSGRDDPAIPIDDIMELRRRAPHAEWVVYEGVGANFTDDHAEGYDTEAHRDALERLTDFFSKHLPPGP